MSQDSANASLNDPSKTPAIRLGAIEFINTIPIYTALNQDAALLGQADCSLSYHNPATLNRLIDEAALDISPVSSAYYLRHQDALTLLDGLSVSSPGAVESVLFLSKTPVDAADFLSRTPVIPVPDDSETSIALLRWLLEQKTGENPEGRFRTFSAADYENALAQYGAALVIGDNALLIHEKPALSATFHVYDLSCEWQKLTGLPFVFAVWVARSHWAQNHPQQLARVSQMLQDSRNLFFRQPEMFEAGVCDAKRRCRVGNDEIKEEKIRHYFKHALDYTLQAPHYQALTKFGKILQQGDVHRFAAEALEVC